MDIRELRIGNCYDQFGNIHQADWTTIKDLSNAPDSQLWCKPIPLTEEWLLKFGFEIVHVKNKHYIINDPNGYKDSHKISILQTLNNQWYIAFSDNLGGYKDYIPTTKIKYVHQLQNLYFALTNEELTIKENGK